KIYRTAVARLLGQPVYSHSAPCPFCNTCFLDCSGVYQTQHKASENVDTAIMEKLKAGATKPDPQRLNRLDLPHANAWLPARLSCTDGKDTILPPKIYRTAVA